jgi:hypothetical protein
LRVPPTSNCKSCSRQYPSPGKEYSPYPMLTRNAMLGWRPLPCRDCCRASGEITPQFQITWNPNCAIWTPGMRPQSADAGASETPGYHNHVIYRGLDHRHALVALGRTDQRRPRYHDRSCRDLAAEPACRRFIHVASTVRRIPRSLRHDCHACPVPCCSPVTGLVLARE